MIIDLTGLRAVVTGSTAGIGFAIANGLAAKAPRSSSTVARSKRRGGGGAAC